jgi:hypothetical protein
MLASRRYVMGLIIVVPVSVGFAQEAEDPAAGRLAVMRRFAEQCQLRPTPESELFELEPTPILRWSNPVSGIEDGTMWLWTKDGIPVATMDLFSSTKGRTLVHQCQSLSTAAFECRVDAAVMWAPKMGGLERRRVSDAQPPADTAAKRLIQLRALAAEFAIEDDFKTKFRGTEFVTHQLRLMPQPVYRYRRSSGDVVDGAIFAYVLGTACEALLVLEARMVNGQPEWQFALAGQTCYALRAKHRGETVWDQPCWDDHFRTNAPYYSFHRTMDETSR